MDERFRVRYENMPLKMVFEQKPISDIRYQLQNLPQEAPLFYLVSPSISRRELLKEISGFYRLDMRVEMVNGEPGFVVVTGRGGSSGGSFRAESMPAPAALRPVSGSLVDFGQGPVSGAVPRAVPAVEEGTAVPVREDAPAPLQVAGMGEVTVESVAGRP